MAKSIECSNPVCSVIIKVPSGATQVTCPDCNTWHFVQSDTSMEGTKSSDDFEEEINYDGAPPAVDSVISEIDEIPDFLDVPSSDIHDDAILPPTLEGLEYDEEITEKPLKSVLIQEEQGEEAVGFLITETGERLPLKNGQNILGRLNTDLVIQDKTVSRKHCVIEVLSQQTGGHEFIIYDIGHIEGSPSTNGVFLSGRSLRLQDYERISIKNDSGIQIGDVRLNLKVVGND